MKFAAVQLLQAARRSSTREKRHLRELLLLALRIAALLLLALAFARPFFATGAALGILRRDRRGARHVARACRRPGRFERAKQLAKEAIARAPAGDLVGVVTFADEARDRREAVRRIACWRRRRSTQRGAGLRRDAVPRGAVRRVAERSTAATGTIVVVTDLQENGWDAGDRASVPDGTTIEVADVGAMPPNLAVTAVRPLGDRRRRHGSQRRPARARRAGAPRDRRSSRRRRVTVPLGPNQTPRRRSPARRAAPRRRSPSTMRTASRPTTSATRCSAARAGRRCWS